MHITLPVAVLALLMSVTPPAATYCARGLTTAPRASLADARITLEGREPFIPVAFSCPLFDGEPYEVDWINHGSLRVRLRAFDQGGRFTRMSLAFAASAESFYPLSGSMTEDLPLGGDERGLGNLAVDVGTLRSICRGGFEAQRQLWHELDLNRLRIEGGIDQRVRFR